MKVFWGDWRLLCFWGGEGGLEGDGGLIPKRQRREEHGLAYVHCPLRNILAMTARIICFRRTDRLKESYRRQWRSEWSHGKGSHNKAALARPIASFVAHHSQLLLMKQVKCCGHGLGHLLPRWSSKRLQNESSPSSMGSLQGPGLGRMDTSTLSQRLHHKMTNSRSV